jgi:hypothetical protein
MAGTSPVTTKALVRRAVAEPFPTSKAYPCVNANDSIFHNVKVWSRRGERMPLNHGGAHMFQLLTVIGVIFLLGFCAGYGTRALNSQRRRMHSLMHGLH